MQSCETPYKVILSEEESRGLETVLVYAAKVTPKLVSVVIKLLAAQDELLEGLGHLKRVRRSAEGEAGKEGVLTVLLGQEGPGVKGRIEMALGRGEGVDVGEMVVVEVPKYAPLTRVQFEAWKGVWPMSFHEDMQRRVVVESEEQAWIEKGLMEAVAAGKKSLSAGEEGVGAQLWDGDKGVWVASAVDERVGMGHPLQHATMRIIAEMAKAYVAKRRLDHPPQKRGSGGEEEAAPPSGYLCTGMTLLLSREPCVMCSMALVHSRIGRVIFVERNAGGGALESHYRLHALPSLNHHFRVLRWTGPLEGREGE